MLKKVFVLAITLAIFFSAACGGDEFSEKDFEPGYCAAGNGGAPDSPDDCPAGAGGQAGAGQAGATNTGGAAGNKAGAAGQAGLAGKAGAAGGSAGSGGKCCAGAAGSAGQAGKAGSAGSSAGAGGQAGAGQAGIAGSGGIGGSTSGASGSGGAGQAGKAGAAGGSAGSGGSAGQPPACGNGIIEVGETCEGSNFNGQTCATLKGPGWTGDLACLGCQTETAPCIPPGPSCGNGVIEVGETCEGSNFNGQTCATLKGAGWTGTPTCSNCIVSDISCVAPPPSCLGGQMKTPTTFTVDAFNAGTTGLTAYELRYDGGETYDDASPIEIDFTATKGPRILVATGNNGIDAKLLNSAVAHPLYNADIETNNVAECQGALIKSQGCDHKIALDLWCTLHPNEMNNCAITTVFASLSSVKSYVVGNPGNTKVAWDVRCLQLPQYLSFTTSNLPRVATKFHRSTVPSPQQ